VKLQRVSTILAIKLADVVISEIIEPEYEDPIKQRYSRVRLPIALRFIDLDRFKVVKPINERTYDVGFIARLEREKGLPEFLCAIKLIYIEGYSPRVIVGGGGSLLGYTKKFLSENGIEAKVLDYIPHNEIPMILNDIKVLVLPSKREGVPTILLEALACGVIPVASKVGGISWLLNTANTGILLDKPTCLFLYRALKTLLTLNTPEMEKLSNKSRRFVEKYLDLQSATMRYRILKVIADD
jgi:glycosyltransferase involved in cell wall biosynthesis